MTRTPEELLGEDESKKRGQSPLSESTSDVDNSNNNNLTSNNNNNPASLRRTFSSSECSSGNYSDPEHDVTSSRVTSPTLCRPIQALIAAAPMESARLTVALSDITNDGQGQRYQCSPVTSQAGSDVTASAVTLEAPTASQQVVQTDRENEPLDLSMNRSPSVEVVASPDSERSLEPVACCSSSSEGSDKIRVIHQKQMILPSNSSSSTSRALTMSPILNVMSRPGRVSPARASCSLGSEAHHHHQHHHHHQKHHNAPAHSSTVPMPLAASGAGGSSSAPGDLRAASPRGSGGSGCLAGSPANKMPARRGSLPAPPGAGGSSGSDRSASPRDRPTTGVAAAPVSATSLAMTTSASSPLLSSRKAASLTSIKPRGENWVPFNKDAVYGIVEEVIHQLEDQKESDDKPQSVVRSTSGGLKSTMSTSSSSNNNYKSASGKSHHRLDTRLRSDCSDKTSRRASPVNSESCSGSEECVSGDDSSGSNSRLNKTRQPQSQSGSSSGLYDKHVGKQSSVVPMCNSGHLRRVCGASSAVGVGQASQEGDTPAIETAAEGDHTLPTALTDRHLISGVISASGASTQSGSANSSPTPKDKQCWVALDKMFVFDIVDSAMRKADDTRGDSDDGSSDGRTGQTMEKNTDNVNLKLSKKASETSSAGKGPFSEHSDREGDGKCLKRQHECLDDKVCASSKKRREGGGQDSRVSSPSPAPTAPHSPNNAVCSGQDGSSEGHAAARSGSPHSSCLEDLLAESNSQKVGPKKCGGCSAPSSPQVSHQNSPVVRELSNMYLGDDQGPSIDRAKKEKIATAKQENMKGVHALTPVIRSSCPMSENNNQCVLGDTKDRGGRSNMQPGGGAGHESSARQTREDTGHTTKHGLVPVTSATTKDARSSPRLGWVAVSKIDVHNIFDSVVDSMIADDVVTSSPVRSDVSDVAMAHSPVPSSSASSSSAGRQVSPATSPLPARDADSSPAASPTPPSSAGSNVSGPQSSMPASPQSPRSPGECTDRNSDSRSTKAFKWKSSLLMRVNEENKPEVQRPSPVTTHARGGAGKQKTESRIARCGRRIGASRKHTTNSVAKLK